MNVFTTDHPLTLQPSWFDKREYPIRSFLCSVLLSTLISAPLILAGLYYYDLGDIGAEPDPFPDPYMVFVVGSAVSIALGFIFSFCAVLSYRLLARNWRSRPAA
jgi:hypothetical protein